MKIRHVLVVIAALFATACVPWTSASCKPVIGQTTQAQMRSMCGVPTDVNRTMTEYGTREQWRYGGYPYTMLPVAYYYFDGNTLVAIQN